MGGITSGCVTYSFRFAENPSTELVKLTDFANRFCEQFMKKGFAMAFELGWGLNFFDYLYVKEHAHTRVV